MKNKLKKAIILGASGLFTFGLDFSTKEFLVRQGVEITQNKGFIFGLFNFSLALFVIFSMTILAITAIAVLKFYGSKSYLSWLGLGMIIGGFAGNLLDRLIFGYVRDFSLGRFFFNLNLADLALTFGGIVLMVVGFLDYFSDNNLKTIKESH